MSEYMEPQGLEDIRKMKGLSRKSLAEMIGVHPNTILNWENDPPRSPVGKVAALCMALDVSPNELVFPFIRLCLAVAEQQEQKNGADRHEDNG